MLKRLGSFNPANLSSAASNEPDVPNLFGRETFDKLRISDDPIFQKFLKKNGDKNEKLVYSNYVTKINSKGKEQQRVLIITDSAVYNVGISGNMKKSPLGAMKRRIHLHQIHAITLSCMSEEFVLHAPNEYDYHYLSDDKFNISKIIEYILQSQKKELEIVYVQQATLHHLANADQKLAKKQTVHEKFEKYWQTRNELKRSGIEQEEPKQERLESFDYKQLIATLKQDVDDKLLLDKYNLEIKSDGEIFADETMDAELWMAPSMANQSVTALTLAAMHDDHSDDHADTEEDGQLVIVSNDYVEIAPVFMRFERLMLDSNDGHQIVLCSHIVNKRLYILNVSRKTLFSAADSSASASHKYQQFSMYKNIDSYECRAYCLRNELDFSLWRDTDKLELLNQNFELGDDINDDNPHNGADKNVDGYRERNMLLYKNFADYNEHVLIWNDEFTAKHFIVKKYDIVTTPQCVIEVNEYYNAGDLAIHLQKNKRFSVSQCKFLIAQVLLAMQFLHRDLNYVIYDLKPENIFIDSNGYIGIAEVQSLDDLKQCIAHEPNVRNNAPEYLSPEILHRNVDRLSVASDFWSVAILTYELLVGVPPFFNDSMEEYDEYLESDDDVCVRIMQQKILGLDTQPLSFPDDMDENAKQFISAFLVVDPSQRLSDWQQIRAHPFLADIPWKKLLYKAFHLPFKPKELHRFGKIKSALSKDWSGRKILDSWLVPSAAVVNEEQQRSFEKLTAFNDQSAWKYFTKLENQI